MRTVILPGLVLILSSLAAAQAPSIDWAKQQPEVLRLHRALIQIDTTAGGETKVVEYLRKIFDAEGIPSKTFATDPNRANFVARLKGNGSKRPLLIMAHTDVVGVQREKWPVDPFGAVLKDSFIWGRGAADDKCLLASEALVMLLLKRSGAKLDRDVIFLAESGEEGETQFGIDFMVKQHFDEIDAEYAISEGGSARLDGGKVSFVAVGTTEKIPQAIRLLVNGISGHASVPRVDNAVTHLAAAVAKLGAWETPVHLNETTRTYFENLAKISPPEDAKRYRALLDPKAAEAAQKYLMVNDPQRYSMLRTSISPTVIKGGFRVNVIPSEAEAIVDIRALPDEDMTKFMAELTRRVNDPAVKIGPAPQASGRPGAPPSRLDSEVFRALERAAHDMYPGAIMLPSMGTGATDLAYLRAKGIQSYGIGPVNTQEGSTNFGAHSDVERLPETSLYGLAEFTWRAVTDVALSKN